MSKPVSKTKLFPMRFKAPEHCDFPNLAKFPNFVDWPNTLKHQPIKLYSKEEEIKEEEMDDTKQTEFIKRKRQRKRSYRTKKSLFLENALADSTTTEHAGEALSYEGQVSNTNVEGADMHSSYNLANGVKTEKNSIGSTKDEAPFKYVLLQFLNNEINVIPVGSMYTFKKPSTTEDQLPAEIDEKMELQLKKKKEYFSRYKAIFSSINASEQRKMDDDEEYVGGFESSSLFQIKKQGSSAGGGGGNGKREKDGNKRANDKGGTNKDRSKFIDENGVDHAAADEFDWCKGDYSATYADDEEDNIGTEQVALNEMEDQEMAASLHYEDAASDDDENEEEDENDEKDQEGPSDITMIRESGLVGDNVLASASEAKVLFSHIHTQAQPQKAMSEGPSAVPARSSLKRSRESEGEVRASTSSSSGSAVTFQDGIVASSGLGAVAVAGANAGVLAGVTTGHPPIAGEYELTDDGVRRYIMNRGGRIAIKEIIEVFKKQVKAFNKAVQTRGGDKSAKHGKARFLDILNRVADNVEDPILGTALTIKAMHNTF